jgi:hypothetical protein
MNAPATPIFVRPDPAAAAPELVAWPLIRRLVAFDTMNRENQLLRCEAFIRRLADRVCAS